MQAVRDEIEAIHLYVVREEEKKPYTLLPLLCAFVCLLGIVALTVYSAEHPYYEHKRLTLPAQFLPLKTFTAVAPIIPTGIQTYPATSAHGTLTITNGSVVTEILPKGIIFTVNGIEVITQSSVIVPAGNAEGYGVAYVQAIAVTSGTIGNIKPLAINVVYGTALYVRNMTSFTGGKDTYSVKVVTSQDKQVALDQTRTVLSQSVHIQAILASPCNEVVSQSLQSLTLQVNWNCQFVSFPHVTIPSARITGITLHGKNLFVDVEFVAQPVLRVYR